MGQSAPSVIIGIDPGTNIMGYGVVECRGTSFTYRDCGVFTIRHTTDTLMKLKTIFESILSLCQRIRPNALAVETQFQGKNVQSMLKLGRAQGVVIAAALHCGVEVFEYAPRRIKQSITGMGGASKEQVAAMLAQMLDLPEVQLKPDATDGLAVALCHHLSSNSPLVQVSTGSKKNNWTSFLAENPDRLA